VLLKQAKLAQSCLIQASSFPFCFESSICRASAFQKSCFGIHFLIPQIFSSALKVIFELHELSSRLLFLNMDESQSEVDEFDYFTDIRAKENELKKINDELDLQLRFSDGSKEENEMPLIVDKTSSTLTDHILSRKPNPAVERNRLQVGRARNDQNDYRGAVLSKRRPSARHKISRKIDSQHVEQSVSNLHSAPISPPQCTGSENDLHCNEGVGKNAMIRLQKARIEALDLQLKVALSAKHDAEDMASKLRMQLKESCQENKRLQNSLTGTNSLAGKGNSEEKSTKDMVDDLKLELNRTKRELESAQKSLKVAESEHKGREIKLSRALQEVEKYKRTIENTASEKRQDSEGIRKENEKLSRQIKLLERQRKELLAAFKKQMKLIEILKRQKVHAEAARLLQFTEDEFMKVIEWEP